MGYKKKYVDQDSNRIVGEKRRNKCELKKKYINKKYKKMFSELLDIFFTLSEGSKLHWKVLKQVIMQIFGGLHLRQFTRHFG